MQVQWYGQSAFNLATAGGTVFIDPFGDLSGLAARGIHFDYPPIQGVRPDLVLVTHEHADHNGVQAVDGSPVVIRSTAGHFPSPLGEVTAIASEHDSDAGTDRGPNTIFSFVLDGIRICHFGDFGQRELREEQATAIGSVDLLFLPVGGGPTIDAEQAAAIVKRLDPRWVVPMHYRTPRIGFLETAEPFLRRFSDVERLPSASFELEEVPVGARPQLIVPAAP